MELVFATHNPHKVREMREMLPGGITLLSMRDIQFEQPVAETEATLEGNACLKAQAVYDASGISCFADDTGLFVESLNGAPGVHSARYAGERADAVANINKLLKALVDQSNRKAHFKTVIAFIHQGKAYYFEGKIDGTITTHPRGSGGFGYDPIFIPRGYESTFAELLPAKKNAISHRAQACKAFIEFLKSDSISQDIIK